VRFMLTTGDNIYARVRVFGVAVGGTGDEDDDWFFTYFQPYRYVINRIPVYPSIGNHDADETEERDDRAQVEDNFYLRERMASEEAAGRASFKPGLFYRFRYGADIEFVCIDTSKEDFFRGKRLFEYPKHWEFVECSFPANAPVRWRIPFAHHPLYSAGPQHHNTRGMDRLLPLFERSGVRVMFSGHEHNFQHSRVDRLDHFVTGAAGKVRKTPPDRFIEAATVSWATDCHFLLAKISGDRMTVVPIGALDDPQGTPAEITRYTPQREPVTGPIEIRGRGSF
jgi:tartrate-resistant acid phosphatase type 5